MPDPQQALKDLEAASATVTSIQAQISRQAASLLDQAIPANLPNTTRHELINSFSEQIAARAARELAKQPHLTPDQYEQAQRQASYKALQYVQKTNNSFLNLTSLKQRQQLEKDLGTVLTNEQAQLLAQAYDNKQQLSKNLPHFQSDEDLAKTVFKNEPTDFGVDSQTGASIIKDIRTQTINKSDDHHLEQATKTAIKNHIDNPDVASQVEKIFQNNQSLINHHVKSASDSLDDSPATPFKPRLQTTTLRQAKALNVDPYALTFVKMGFPENDPRIPSYLKADIQSARNLIDNPQSAKSFSGKIVASSLQPQIFVAQKHYFPVFDTYQKGLKTAEKYFEKPIGFYKQVDKKYQGLKKSYNTIVTEKKIGWIITPRRRYQYWWNTTKANLISKVSEIVDNSQFLSGISKTWNNWSPGQIKRRISGWVIKQLGSGIGALAKKTGSQFLTTLAGAVLESSTVVGIPLAIFSVTFGFAKGLFNKLKQQIGKQKAVEDAAGIAAKAFQSIMGGLKLLASLVAGSLGGLIGSIVGAVIGFLVFGPVGAVIGFFGGGIIGTAIGSLIGFNWLTLAAIPASIGLAVSGFFSSLGSSASIATPLALGSTTVAITAPILFSQYYQNTLSSAFFLPDSDSSGSPENYSSEELILTGLASNCPDNSQEITASLAQKTLNGLVNLLPNSLTIRTETNRICIKPTKIIIHWSGDVNHPNGWDSGNDATYNTLVDRDRTCQQASDTNDVFYMLPFYQDEVEMSWCAGEWNIYSINDEISGAYFTDNPPPPDQSVINHAISATCVVMKQYNIPVTQIFGHYQVPNNGGKIDPGEAFLQNVFIPAVQKKCG